MPASGSRSAIATRSFNLWIDRVDRTELDDLRGRCGNEAAIGRAAGAGEFGLDAGQPRESPRRDVDQPAARRQERMAMAGPGQVVVEAVTAQDGVEAAFASDSRVLAGRIAKIEQQLQRARE